MTRFGAVTIVAPTLSPKAVQEQISAGHRAVRKLAQVLSRPGIKSSKEDRHIPHFQADPERPDLVVRVFEGVTERGRFVRGKFVKIA